MNMRSGAASSGSERSYNATLVQLGSGCNGDLREMSVARPDTVAVIYFNGVAVGAAGSRKDHDTGRRRVNITALFAAEIDAGMAEASASGGCA